MAGEKGSSSAESKAFREISGDLIEFIENPHILAWKLYSKKLIEKDTREKATLETTPRFEKCMAIVETLERQIGLEPMRLCDFLEVLGSDESTLPLYQQLNAVYVEIKKKMEKSIRSNAPGMVIMESLLPRLQTTLRFMKDMDVGKDYKDDEKRTEVIELLGKFIEKSLQGGAVLDDLKMHFSNLRNEQMLLKESEYRWAMSTADETYIAMTQTKQPVKYSPENIKKQPEEPLFNKDTLYHASLCCLTVHSCDTSNYHDFLRTKHPHNEFSEASLSRQKQGELNVDRYLIARQGKTYYVAFKGEPNLEVWKTKFKSFEEGIKIQSDGIPIRFFVQKINDGFQIVFTGFSFGGLLACSVASKLCRDTYMTSDQLVNSVVCITFGQPILFVEAVHVTAQQIPVLNSITHMVLLEEDTIPHVMKFLDKGFGGMSQTNMEGTVKQVVHDPFSSLIIQQLTEVQKASVHENSLPVKQFDDLKELLLDDISKKEVLSNGANETSLGAYYGKIYKITSTNLFWKELSQLQIIDEVAPLNQEKIKTLKCDLFFKHKMNEYYKYIAHGYLEKTPMYALPPKNTNPISELSQLKPKVSSVAFHRHGKELAVDVEGDNLWFCTKIQVASIQQIQIEAENVSSKSIQFNYTPRDENDLPVGDTVKVHLQSHFTNPIRKPSIPVKRKVYRFTYRQEQLAKHTPSELIELAYMSVLLEKHPFSEFKPYSNRFEVLHHFLEDIGRVVPMESIPYTIASIDSELVSTCCQALIQAKIQLPFSSCMCVGIMRAISRLINDETISINESGLYQAESRSFLNQFNEFTDDWKNLHTDIVLTNVIGNLKVTVGQHVALNNNGENVKTGLKKAQRKGMKTAHKLKKPSAMSGKPTVPYFFRTGSLQTTGTQQIDMVNVRLQYHRFIESVRATLSCDHSRFSLISKLLEIAPISFVSPANVLCGQSIDLLYPITSSTSTIHSPLQIIRVGRQLLSQLVEESLVQTDKTTESLSHLYNNKMLQIINNIRQHDLKLCTSLLGAFMEEQMQVPMKGSSFSTAEAIVSIVSVAAIGIWALFNLSYHDVNKILGMIPNHQLLVQIKEYIKGIFSENTITLDKEYAGKLQFMVQGLDKTVSCNSHYISYSLERQLVILCDKLNISALTLTEKIVEKWDTLFKDNVLSLVSISHRPLIARWMRWALMVHNLREELAKYTAVGIVGLVNSGKSKLVGNLFGIQVEVGTTECKRTTVPFLYNLDEVVEGLDVIDFPGVDDRDESIPDLAELLLSIAQVVVFVVDYRRVHTESAKRWLEYLESEPVQVLVCLTHADRLYVEYMGEDGTHRPTDIVRKEIKIQLDMIKEKLKPCPKHKVQFFSFCQDKDSVLNTPEGRKILHDVGIQTPLDVGDWLIDVFRNHLDQEELAERLKDYIHKDEEPSME